MNISLNLTLLLKHLQPDSDATYRLVGLFCNNATVAALLYAAVACLHVEFALHNHNSFWS